MKEGLVNQEMVFVSDDEAAEVAQPGESALNLPSFSITAQRAAIVERRFYTIAPMRGDQKHSLFPQALAQGIAVISTISNDPQWFSAPHLDALKG